MFLQLNPNTFIRSEHIAAVDFTQSAARVYVIGVPTPYRVMAPDVLSQLHQLVDGEPKVAIQASPTSASVIEKVPAAEAAAKPARPRRKSA